MIFGCLLKDELLARAWQGDQKARSALLRLLPSAIPARELVRQRDERLREIATRLRADQVKISERALARMLSDAGSRLRLPRASLPGFKPFDVLSFSERQLLADEVRTILSWSADMRWPDIDQMRNVLRGLGG